jgi:hypothetical protein
VTCRALWPFRGGAHRSTSARRVREERAPYPDVGRRVSPSVRRTAPGMYRRGLSCPPSGSWAGVNLAAVRSNPGEQSSERQRGECGHQATEVATLIPWVRYRAMTAMTGGDVRATATAAPIAAARRGLRASPPAQHDHGGDDGPATSGVGAGRLVVPELVGGGPSPVSPALTRIRSPVAVDSCSRLFSTGR